MILDRYPHTERCAYPHTGKCRHPHTERCAYPYTGKCGYPHRRELVLIPLPPPFPSSAYSLKRGCVKIEMYNQNAMSS